MRERGQDDVRLKRLPVMRMYSRQQGAPCCEGIPQLITRVSTSCRSEPMDVTITLFEA